MYTNVMKIHAINLISQENIMVTILVILAVQW